MKKKIELKRINGEVIFSHECEDNSIAKTIDAFRISGAEFDLIGVDLRNSDLRVINFNGINLRGANLSGSNLEYVNFRGANLCNANLEYTNLVHANLRYAALGYANLRYADLTNADLKYTNLSSANLSGANLSNSDLRGSSLGYANFSNAKLDDANLYNTSLSEKTAFLLPQCPSEGSFVAWKKASGMIVKLLVTEDAKRSSATTMKCRCSKAKVLAIENIDGSKSELKEIESSYNSNFVYRVGKTVEVKDFDDSRWKECSSGIHFFIAREMAAKY